MTRLVRWSSLFFLAASLAACSSDSNTPTMATTTGTTTGTTATQVVVTITGMNAANSFTPSPATVKSGQTVVWHNSDSIAHTATQDAGVFDTGSIAPGASSAPVTIPVGTYGYHCSIHPTMVGTLDVVQ
jgi:plastocyanin